MTTPNYEQWCVTFPELTHRRLLIGRMMQHPKFRAKVFKAMTLLVSLASKLRGHEQAGRILMWYYTDYRRRLHASVTRCFPSSIMHKGVYAETAGALRNCHLNCVAYACPQRGPPTRAHPTDMPRTWHAHEKE